MAGEQQGSRKAFGNYELVRELGRGGMGIVYKAHEVSLQRMVALKILPPKYSQDAAFVKRFVREARAGARLSHPNIVPIFAVGEHGGTHFIAMDYVKGETLAEIIARDGQMDTDRALDIVRQAAKGLSEAHRHGVVHRDIKPHNIMIDEAGRVRILDFGLARILTSETQLTSEGESMGTPSYMSPEQCHATDVDQRTDIYSLGVTLYQMLTGELPFSADSPMATMFQIVKGEHKSVTELNRSVPKPVVQILERMMATKPKDRYQDAKTLLKDLKAVARGVALPAPGAVSARATGIDFDGPIVGGDVIRPSSAFQPLPRTQSASRMPKPRFIAAGVTVVLVVLGISWVLWSGVLSPVPILEVRAYPEHVVHFPDDRQVGALALKNWDSDVLAYLDDIPKPAQGDFTVPRGKDLSLSLFSGTGAELIFLDALAPTDLQNIYFDGAPVTDDDLKHIKHLTGLRSLVFRDTQVTGEGLVHLKSLKNLNFLLFLDGSVGGKGLVHLEDLSSLSDLLFWGGALRDEDLHNLGALTALKEFQIRNNKNVTGTGLASLENLTGLWRVDLRESGITDEGLEHLANLPGLTWLHLNETEITDEGLALLPSFPSLQNLYLNGLGDRVSNDGLVYVAQMPSLIFLSIPFCNFTVEGVRHLSQASSLKTININGLSVTPAMVDALKGIPNLNGLSCEFRDAIPLSAVPLLEGWTGLKFLNLQGTPVDDSYVEVFSKLTQLEGLYLNDTQMTRAGLDQLRRNLPNTDIQPH